MINDHRLSYRCFHQQNLEHIIQFVELHYHQGHTAQDHYFQLHYLYNCLTLLLEICDIK